MNEEKKDGDGEATPPIMSTERAPAGAGDGDVEASLQEEGNCGEVMAQEAVEDDMDAATAAPSSASTTGTAAAKSTAASSALEANGNDASKQVTQKDDDGVNSSSNEHAATVATTTQPAASNDAADGKIRHSSEENLDSSATIPESIPSSSQNPQELSTSAPEPTPELRLSLPGAYRVAGPGAPDSNASGGSNNDEEEEEEKVEEEEEEIFEGFVPEPTPDEIARQQAKDLLASAIRLDDSLVKTIPMETKNDEGSRKKLSPHNENDDVQDVENGQSQGNAQSLRRGDGGASANKNEGTASSPLSSFFKSPVTLIFITVIFLGAIGLGVGFSRSKSANNSVPSAENPSISSVPSSPPPSGPSSIPNDNNNNEILIQEPHIQERYNYAKSLVLNGKITSQDILDDATSPQSKALNWISYEDQISSGMIDNRDPTSGILPKQAYGTQFGVDSGESQVLRRYALATFYYSTSQSASGPWDSTYNFLSPTKHECMWHRNYTRANFPFGDIDPAGFVCSDPTPVGWGESQKFWNEEYSDIEIGDMTLNFRIKNNLNGTIPPEIGHISGLAAIMISYQDGLYGSIPAPIDNLVNLSSISIEFAGKDFGGEIPASLLTLPSLEYISFLYWEGMVKFPPSLESGGESRNLLGLLITGNNDFSGGIPSYISEFTKMKSLEISGSSLGGTIPESFGDLESLEHWNFYNNSLVGTLPQSLEKLNKLSALVFGRNKFQGSLPRWLGNLDQLLLLDLSYNEFEGTLPPELSQMSSLEHISLQHNGNLNGSVAAFEPLQKLSSLLLYGNSFSSTIPENLFANFTPPIFADFGHNRFSGKLPQTFSNNAKNTSYLTIMRNDFDTDAVDDILCDEVGVLNADCSSCPCCANCCSEDSVLDSKDPYCNYDLDFFRLTKLECGVWWYACFSADPQAYYEVEPT